MPMTRLSTFPVLQPQDPIEQALSSWIFDSHNWVEKYSGYFECQWCKTFHTGMQGISLDYPLCPGNPAMKSLRMLINKEAFVMNELRTLRLGDTGHQVSFLQSLLGSPPSGIYGPQTMRQVESFQAAHGLAIDGVVGENTWKELLRVTRTREMSGASRDQVMTDRGTTKATESGPALTCIRPPTDMEMKDWIDKASYQELLAAWRYEEDGSPWLQRETGRHLKERMDALRRSLSIDEQIRISKAPLGDTDRAVYRREYTHQQGAVG